MNKACTLEEGGFGLRPLGYSCVALCLDSSSLNRRDFTRDITCFLSTMGCKISQPLSSASSIVAVPRMKVVASKGTIRGNISTPVDKKAHRGARHLRQSINLKSLPPYY